jgi:hypothetical protein
MLRHELILELECAAGTIGDRDSEMTPNTTLFGRHAASVTIQNCLSLLRTPDNGARCMSKPTKTTLQLETLVKQQVAKTMSIPKNLVMSVWPDGDSWKVVCHSPNPREDKECFELIRNEAERLKLKFDLRL